MSGPRLHLGLQVLLAAAFVVGLNLLAARRVVPVVRADWTREGRNTLHPDTAALFRGLRTPVGLYLFYTPLRVGPARARRFTAEVFQRTEVLIRQAAFLSRRIHAEVVRPAANPGRAQAVLARTGLPVEEARGNFLLVHGRGRNVRLPFGALAEEDPRSGRLRFRGEDALYKAVGEVTRRQAHLVTFAVGRGELSPTDPRGALPFARLLDREAYRIGRVDLGRGERILPGTTVLVVAGPTRDYDEASLEALRRFHAGGGNLLVLLGARTPARKLRRWLRQRFALELADRDWILFDPRGVHGRFPEWIVVRENLNPTHPVTRPLVRREDRPRFVFPVVRPLRLKAPGVCDYLAYTHPGSWPDRLRRGHYRFRREEDETWPGWDTQGFPLMVAVDPRRPGQGRAGAEAGRLVLVCSREALSAEVLQGSPANAALFLQAIHWLAGRELGERITPVTVRRPHVTLTRRERTFLFWLAVVLPPGAVALLGLLVWWWRRG